MVPLSHFERLQHIRTLYAGLAIKVGATEAYSVPTRAAAELYSKVTARLEEIRDELDAVLYQQERVSFQEWNPDQDPNDNMFRNLYACDQDYGFIRVVGMWDGEEDMPTMYLQYGVSENTNVQPLFIGSGGHNAKVAPSQSCTDCTRVLRWAAAEADPRILGWGDSPIRVLGHNKNNCPLTHGKGEEVDIACEAWAKSVSRMINHTERHG